MKNVTNNIVGSVASTTFRMMAKSMHVTSQGPVERDLPSIACFEGNLDGERVQLSSKVVLGRPRLRGEG